MKYLKKYEFWIIDGDGVPNPLPKEDNSDQLTQKDSDKFKIETEIDLILEECSDCVKLIKLTGKFFWRGISNREDDNIIQYFTEGRVRFPKDTPKVLHELFNEIFFKKFGWKVRDGVFVYRDTRSTWAYGDPFMIFPNNGFKYVWSTEIKDLYTKLSYDKPYSEYIINFLNQNDINDKQAVDLFYQKYKGSLDNDYLEEDDRVTLEKWREILTIDWLYKWLETLISTHIDTDIEKKNSKDQFGYEIHDTEIMIKCDKYYAINIEHKNIIMEKLNMI